MEQGKNQIEMRYGVMYPTIEKQLKNQGFKFDKEKATKLNACRDAIFRLLMSGIITESQSNACYGKLHKKVVRIIE